MDPLRFMADQDGFFTRAMAREIGYDDKAVSAQVRHGAWTRFRRGYYTFTDLWSSFDQVTRHRVRSRAVLHSLGDRVALSHVSAAVAHGIDVWGVDLGRVHITRLDGGAGRIEGDVVHHVGAVASSNVVEVDGLRVTCPVRSAIECGSVVTPESALVLFNSMLHQGLAEPEHLQREFEALGSWPGVRRLHIPVRLADPRVESVGESRGMWLFWTQHLPRPVVQYPVFDAEGTLRGTCDWGWPEEGVLGEFDGRVKYGRLLESGQGPGDVVFAEKQREDLLRELTGFTMIRLVWSDLDRPRLIRSRVERLFGRSA
jgi:hypothetical protein